jgi:hypothetical protein
MRVAYEKTDELKNETSPSLFSFLVLNING